MSAPVAIITGASRGIGAGLVAGYRRAGYAVVGVALSLPASDENDYVAVAGDLADAETARRAVDQALDRFGRIDTLINNAGVYIGKPFTQYTAENYAAITAVNLTGSSPSSRSHRWSSGAAGTSSTSPPPWSTTRTASGPLLCPPSPKEDSSRPADHWRSNTPLGVRVNAVSLGVIKTPAHDPASYKELDTLHPLGRVGEISDVVDAILYLERATFVTGETLHVDGGQAAGH